MSVAGPGSLIPGQPEPGLVIYETQDFISLFLAGASLFFPRSWREYASGLGKTNGRKYTTRGIKIREKVKRKEEEEEVGGGGKEKYSYAVVTMVKY